MKFTGVVLILIGLTIALFGFGSWAFTDPVTTTAEAATQTPVQQKEDTVPLMTMLLPLSLLVIGIGTYMVTRGGTGVVATRNMGVQQGMGA